MFITVLTTACHLFPPTATESNRSPVIAFQTHFNIILPSMTRSSKWSLPITYPDPNPVFSIASIGATFPANLILLYFLSPYHYFTTCTIHKALHYAVSPITLSLLGANVLSRTPSPSTYRITSVCHS